MSSQIIIKPVTNDFFNRPNINNFIETVFVNFYHLYDFPILMHNKNEISRLLSSNKFRGFVAFNSNIIIGYLLGELVTINGEEYLFVNYLYVAPTMRSKNIGTSLIIYAKNFCKTRNCRGIKLMVDTENEKNIKFYQKNNFSVLPDEVKQQRHELFTFLF